MLLAISYTLQSELGLKGPLVEISNIQHIIVIF